MADDHDGEILMGCWDCGSCGARRLRGDSYQCASCGAPRPENVKFYLPADAEVLRDEEGIRAAEAGPDWQCAFCQSWMPGADEVCRNCQATVDESERRQKTRTYEEAQLPKTGQHTAQEREQQLRGVYPTPNRHPIPRRSPSVPVMILIAVLGIAAVIYGVNLVGRRQAYQQKVAEHQSLVADAQGRVDRATAGLNEAARRVEQAEQAVARAKSDVTRAQDRIKQLRHEQQSLERAPAVSVVAHAWNVQLKIEECTAKKGEGWNHAPDAFDVRSEQRVHHHEKVLDRVETLYRTETYRAQDGYDTETYIERVSAGTRQVQDGYTVEDLGNGRFRRTPKYRTESVYENVTKTRQKPRMVTKTRQVPYQENVYRQDPVHKPWYTYRTKVWTPAPPMSRSGEGLKVLDPEGRPPQNPGMELGARRVRDRQVVYTLTLQPIAKGNPPRTITMPEARWRSFADGATALLAKNEPLTEEERQARLDSLRGRIQQATKQIRELEARVPPLVDRIEPLREKLPLLRQTLIKSQTDLSEEKQRLEAVIAKGY